MESSNHIKNGAKPKSLTSRKINYIMMKKLVTICFLALGISAAYSQTVNDVPIKEIDVEYIQIVGVAKMFNNQVTIQIDFGQRSKFFKNTTQVKDEEGKPLSFNSMIDAL